MELIPLDADVRSDAGKGVARKLRSAGRLPAIFYGKNADTTMVSVDMQIFRTAIRKNEGAQLFFNLRIKNGDVKERSVMVKEFQRDILKGDYIHVDFYEVSMDQKIWVSVPVEAVGKAKGVEMGGMLQIIRYNLDVLCLPGAIPNAIEIDVTDLDVGDAVHIHDLNFDGLEFDSETNFTVLTVLGKEAEPVEGEEIEGEDEAVAEGDGDTGEAASE